MGSLELAKLDAGARLRQVCLVNPKSALRKSLEIAGQLAPVVLWIDEIEKGVRRQWGQRRRGTPGCRSASWRLF